MKNKVLFREIKKKYIELGVKKSQILYITADFGKIFNNNQIEKNDYLYLHFKAIEEIIGKNGTIIVPTATLNLTGTKKIFDVLKTPSYEMGVFSEYIRKKKKSVRSHNPLWSVASIGKEKKYFTTNLSNHTFGYNSVHSKLIEKNALSLNIGVKPRLSISLIHYIELICGVPYRFTKSFKQKVKYRNKIIKKEFYHFVLRKEKKIIRDRNIKIFKNFESKRKINKTKIDGGYVYLYSLNDFFNVTKNFMSKDLYVWLKRKK